MFTYPAEAIQELCTELFTENVDKSFESNCMIQNEILEFMRDLLLTCIDLVLFVVLRDIFI